MNFGIFLGHFGSFYVASPYVSVTQYFGLIALLDKDSASKLAFRSASTFKCPTSEKEHSAILNGS